MSRLPILCMLIFSFSAVAKVASTPPKEPKTRLIVNKAEKFKFVCPLDLKIDISDGHREILEPLRDQACDKIEISKITGPSFEKIAAHEEMGEIKTVNGVEKFTPKDEDVKEYKHGKIRIMYTTIVSQCGYDRREGQGHGGYSTHVAIITNGVRTLRFATTDAGECGGDMYLMTMEEFESIIKSFEFTD